jgi:hypothetical protein
MRNEKRKSNETNRICCILLSKMQYFKVTTKVEKILKKEIEIKVNGQIEMMRNSKSMY